VQERRSLEMQESIDKGDKSGHILMVPRLHGEHLDVVALRVGHIVCASLITTLGAWHPGGS